MKKVLSQTFLGLLAGSMTATFALAADAGPRPRTKAAGITVNTSTNDAAQPQPIQWDRLEKSSVERTTRKRSPPPVALPADVTEPAAKMPAERS